MWQQFDFIKFYHIYNYRGVLLKKKLAKILQGKKTLFKMLFET